MANIRSKPDLSRVPDHTLAFFILSNSGPVGFYMSSTRSG